MNRKVKGAVPAQYRKRGQLELGEALTTFGYPMGLPKKVCDGSKRKISKKYFTTNLDVSSGSSGGGAFNSYTGLLEGILIEGEDDFNYDSVRKCRWTRRCFDYGCQGESVLKISEVIPYIQEVESR